MHCHRAVRHLVLVAVALVVSCDKSTAPRSTVPVASVTVSPAVASIALGQTVQLTATPRDSQGNGLAGRGGRTASTGAPSRDGGAPRPGGPPAGGRGTDTPPHR